MGSSSSKTQSTQQQTTTPTTPGYVSSALQNQINSIGNLAGTNPSNYVAPASANQNAAYAAGAGLDNTSSNYGTATDLANKNSSVGADQISNFMNPYTQDVVNSSLASYDQQAAQQQAQNAAAGAVNGAFGGSRYGILQGQQQASTNLNRATLQSGLLSSGYNTAVTDALANANLGQTAASNLSNIGSTQDADNRANLATQDALGQDQRSIAQSQATAPLSLAQSIGQLLSQLGVGAQDVTGSTGNASGTSTTTSSPSIFADITGALKAAGQVGSTGTSIASFFGA
jgi:hypothetical protein